MEIFVSCNLSDTQASRLRALGAEDVFHIQREEDGDNGSPTAAFLNSEVVLGNIPPGWIPQTKSLRWLQLCSVGFNEYRSLDWHKLRDRVVLTNLAGFFADPVAESALAGILALYRGIDRLLPLQHRRQWVGDPLRAELRLLTGARVVLFGFGSINRRLAELLTPFGCHITHFSSDWTTAELDTALMTADIVVSTVPETDATLRLFDKERLKLLKKDALFVNFGRGSVVDEAALVAALNDRQIGGAVVDVTDYEPLPKTHPLWTTPNTLLTQHTGGGTMDERDRVISVFADNLARYRSGKPLSGVVHFERGY